MNEVFNNIIDKTLSEHQGSGIYSRKANGKYSLFIPVQNLGEIGSAPETIQKTSAGNMAHSYIEGRKDSPQQSLSYYVHRDNLRILEKVKGKTVDLLRVFPDFSAIKYSGIVNYTVGDTGIGSAEQGTVTVTVTIPEEVVDDCFDLLEDTAMFITDVPECVKIAKSGTYTLDVVTNPADATITATSETDTVVTATASDKKVTITAKATNGSAIVEIKASAEGYASWSRTIHVIVK